MEDQAEYNINVCPPEESHLNDERFNYIVANAEELSAVLSNTKATLDDKIDTLLGAVLHDKTNKDTPSQVSNSLIDIVLDAQQVSLKVALAMQERIATI